MAGIKVKLKIKGLKKLSAKFKQSPAIVRRSMDRAIRDAMFSIEREVKPITPVDTGRLRGSFKTVLRSLQGQFGTNVEYARDVHDLYPAGQRYRNPSKNSGAISGFMIIGLKRSQPTIQRIFRRGLKDITIRLAS